VFHELQQEDCPQKNSVMAGAQTWSDSVDRPQLGHLMMMMPTSCME